MQLFQLKLVAQKTLNDYQLIKIKKNLKYFVFILNWIFKLPANGNLILRKSYIGVFVVTYDGLQRLSLISLKKNWQIN